MEHHEKIMEYLGTSWNIMEHHRTSWNIMEHHGTSWNVMEHHETSWNKGPKDPKGILYRVKDHCGQKKALAGLISHSVQLLFSKCLWYKKKSILLGLGIRTSDTFMGQLETSQLHLVRRAKFRVPLMFELIAGKKNEIK